MKEQQERELERQANNYSYDYFERKLHGYLTDIPNARLIALFMAVEVLGYEFKVDHEESFLGVKYYKYKLVKIN